MGIPAHASHRLSGRIHLDGFYRHCRRGQGDDILGEDVRRMLQSIHTYFIRITQRVPMVQVKGFSQGNAKTCGRNTLCIG